MKIEDEILLKVQNLQSSGAKKLKRRKTFLNALKSNFIIKWPPFLGYAPYYEVLDSPTANVGDFAKVAPNTGQGKKFKDKVGLEIDRR